MASQESCRRLTLTSFLKPRPKTTLKKISKPHFVKCRQTIGTRSSQVAVMTSHVKVNCQRGQASLITLTAGGLQLIYRDQAQNSIIYYSKWIEKVKAKWQFFQCCRWGAYSTVMELSETAVSCEWFENGHIEGFSPLPNARTNLQVKQPRWNATIYCFWQL